MKEEDRRERARRKDEMCLWTTCDGGHSTTLRWGRPTPPASACPATATPSWWPGSAGSDRLHQGYQFCLLYSAHFINFWNDSQSNESGNDLRFLCGSQITYFSLSRQCLMRVIPWLRICMSMSYILLFLESDMITVHSWAAVSCPAALVSLCLSWQRYERSHGAGANWKQRKKSFFMMNLHWNQGTYRDVLWQIFNSWGFNS